MTRLGRGGAVFEAERPFVVGDQRGRDGFAGVGIGEAHQPQTVDHAPGRGELDPCDCVVPAFRRSMPAALVLREAVGNAGESQSLAVGGLVFAEASFPTLFGPVGGAANPGMPCLTGSRRCLRQSAHSGSPLQPWSAAPSTARFSGSAYRGPDLAMALRRVLVVAAVSLGVGRAGFTGCPGLSRAVCRGLGLAGGARSVSGTSSSLQNLRDRHSLAGPDCLGVFERAWQSLCFSRAATRPLSRSARGQGLQFRPRTWRHRATGRVFPGRRGGLARLSHPGLASADRLVADFLLAGGFRDGGLAGRCAQHDPGHAIRGPNLGGQIDVRPRLTRSKDHAGRTPAAVP